MMNDRNMKTENAPCNENICNEPIACNCQGLCICDDFINDAEVFACQDCCCQEDN